MKILYAIQGTGNGHLSRANDIIPILRRYGHLDILVSGKCADVSIPYTINYKLEGLSFIFGKNGDIDLWKTLKAINFQKLGQEIRHLPVKDYDLIVNDFEPVSAWAAKLRGVPCVGLSHQAAVAHKNSPKHQQPDWFGQFILDYYAPAQQHYGFHFASYGQTIFTPVIRQQVRNQEIRNDGHYTVYLPAYGDETLIRKLTLFKDTKWKVFSKHSKLAYQVENVSIAPINNEEFIKSMATCEGVLCGAGFETPAEALFLNKKLMVVPMKSQYEQQCNAASLKQMGVPVLKNLKQKRLHKIEAWLNSNEQIVVDYADNTASIIQLIMEKHYAAHPPLIPNVLLILRPVTQLRNFRKTRMSYPR
jgi:uncharacterized protein (TIGR00661 family)